MEFGSGVKARGFGVTQREAGFPRGPPDQLHPEGKTLSRPI